MKTLLKWAILLAFVWLLIPDSQAQSDVTFIPERAKTLSPVIKSEIIRLTPDFYKPEYYYALIELESCYSLTGKKCYNPTTEMRVNHKGTNVLRERGAGLGQLTITYNKDGSVRYDGLGATRQQFYKELSELNWDNILLRPDLQVRTMVLMTRSNWKIYTDIKDYDERLKFTDVSYNAGPGSVRSDRRLCSLTKGCNPNRWSDNVENTCTASKVPVEGYGGRSFCRIRREHPRDVFRKMPKYKSLYENTMAK